MVGAGKIEEGVVEKQPQDSSDTDKLRENDGDVLDTSVTDKLSTNGQKRGKRARTGQDQSGKSMKRKLESSASKGIPQGKPKSGRVWKEKKKRFSDMVKDRPLKTSWEVKMRERQEKKMVKTLAEQLKEEKRTAKEEKRKRREENLRRRLINERKAEVVQVIRNPTKLKRARRKQLRSIEKRDTLVMSQTGKTQPQKKTKVSQKKTKAKPSQAK